MATSDYGQPTDPLSQPSLSAWAGSVHAAIQGKAPTSHSHTGYAATDHTHPPTGVAAGGVATTLWAGTQAQFDAIATKDPGTVYVVTP